MASEVVCHAIYYFIFIDSDRISVFGVPPISKERPKLFVMLAFFFNYFDMSDDMSDVFLMPYWFNSQFEANFKQRLPI